MGTVLRQVVVWPFTGPYSESWADGEAPPDHPAHDAFLRIMRRVSEAYAPHLADQKVPNRTSEVRLSVCGIGVDDTVTLSVVPDPKPDPSSFELVDLILPSTFAEATGTAQADTGLAVIAAAVASLAPSRGWSTAALDQAERNTRAGGIQCRYVSPWNASPGRRYKARLIFTLHDDGFAWVELETATRDDQPIATSGRQRTWASRLAEMRSFTRKLRWSDPVTVTFDQPLGRGTSLSIAIDSSSATGTVIKTDCDPGTPRPGPTPRRTEPFSISVLPPNTRLWTGDL